MYQTAKIIEIYPVSVIIMGIHVLLLHYCKRKTCGYRVPVRVQNRVKLPKKHPNQGLPKHGVPVKNLTPAVKNLINPANKKFYGKIKFMD